MWLFADFGLLMPVTVPMDKADPQFTEGKYDFQVRGRLDSHLRYFMDNFMEPGTFHDEIQYTPYMDYNVRFYTTQEAFAEAVKKVALAIDYKNFKPASERKNEDGTPKFKHGGLYHSVLDSIWATVGRLNTPGGIWGPYSKKNPKGYGKASTTLRGGYKPLGATFFEDDDWGTYRDAPAVLFDDFDDDWKPEREEEIELILESLRGIPVEEWYEYCNESEWILIRDIAMKEMEAEWTRQLEEERQKRKAQKRNRNKQYSKRNKARKGKKARYQ